MESSGLPLVLLVNPSAAGGRTLKLLPRIEAALDERRVEFRVLRTRDLEHGVDAALRAVEAGELPVVVSGDGLIGAIGGAMAGRRDRARDHPRRARQRPRPRPRDPRGPGGGGRGPRRRPLAADRRRRGQRQALPRHRQRRLRLRSEPARQRNEALPRQPRLRLRGAADAGRLEAGAVHGPGRRRADPVHRVLGLGRQQPGLRRWHVRRARRRARRRPVRRGHGRRGRQAPLRG